MFLKNGEEYQPQPPPPNKILKMTENLLVELCANVSWNISNDRVQVDHRFVHFNGAMWRCDVVIKYYAQSSLHTSKFYHYVKPPMAKPFPLTYLVKGGAPVNHYLFDLLPSANSQTRPSST